MLTAWDPFAEISRLQDQFLRTGNNQTLAPFKPSVDIFEDESGIHVTAELAGVKPSDIKVKVENNVLTVSGERKLESEEKKRGYHRVERSYGKFSRSFALGEDVNAEAIEARHDNGVLHLTLPRRASTQKREIQVQAK
jgi:HSP20 family protein